jgi:hypothetical protein
MDLDLTLNLNPMSLHKPKLGIKLGLVGFKGFFYKVQGMEWSRDYSLRFLGSRVLGLNINVSSFKVLGRSPEF